MINGVGIFKSKEELIKKAEETSSVIKNTNYKESIYLYFIARYFVSLYEAKFGTIPIQVWNEYRNSLDHFFRDLTNPDNNHLKKMSGHLQRAVLDILKLYCHSIQEEVKKLKNDIKPEILRLVDNGDFSKKLDIDINKSNELFATAKIKDSSLGDDSHTNKEIIGNYLDAVYSFDTTHSYINEKFQDIDYAKYNYESIHTKAEKGSFKEHMKTHYIFYISWTMISSILQLIYNFFLADYKEIVVNSMINLIKSVFN
ncbi:MAG: hypothetical protein RBT22_12750 [Aliarcobacter sp.]|nr:hypothetical protein [Aliarcobacter sp.]